MSWAKSQRRGVETKGTALIHADVGTQVLCLSSDRKCQYKHIYSVARKDTRSLLVLAESERCQEVLKGRVRFERMGGKGGDWEDREMVYTPRYRCRFIFSDLDTGRSWATSCMKFELPVLWPSVKEFANKEAIKTIKEHSQLFMITISIKNDNLKKHLQMHLNQIFDQSIAIALREGF